ncbi:MAG: 30S ribosomal protein S18, partial [Acetanaerobacterium sp.]
MDNRNDRGDRGDRPGPRGPRKGRRKVCAFCVDRVHDLDYKDVAKLRKYLSERAK